MNFEDLVEEQIAGAEPDVPEDLREDFARAVAAHEALQYALGETLLVPAAEPADRPPPQMPDDYEIVRELGRGGMGVVYLARQKSLDRMVAIKVLRPGELTFGPLVRRFLDEARHLARLRHPNVVSVHEVGEAAGEPYFSMDYVDGESLSELLSRERVSPTRALAILKQAAEGVAHAHQLGIIHRDLKPGNILIDRQGRAYVTDFGLARNMTDDADRTHSGALVGTPQYMAPEQARGDSKLVGEATDVHALGAILYELLTGRPPFGRDAPVDVLLRVVHEEPLAPRRIDARIPRDLETICQKALAKRPEERYSTVRAFLEDIRRYETGEPLMARRPGIAYHARRLIRRYGKLAAAALLPAVVVAAAGLAVAPRIFDKSVSQLMAWGDEEEAAKKHAAAAGIYRRALAKAEPALREQLLERIVNSVRNIDDEREAIEEALPILDAVPEVSFGKHDFLIAQASLTRLRSKCPQWLHSHVDQDGVALMRMAEKRIAIVLAGSMVPAAERQTAEDVRQLLVTRIAGNDPPLGAPPASPPPLLPEGEPAALLARAEDAARPSWDRGRAAYAAGAAWEQAGDRGRALTAYRKAYPLLTATFPIYAGAANSITSSWIDPNERRNLPDQPECRLIRDAHAALKRLDPTAPDDLRGGIQFQIEGVPIPSNLLVGISLELRSPSVPVNEPRPAILSQVVPVQVDQTARVGVADGRYRMMVASSKTWFSSPDDLGNRLELDMADLPQEIEIRGGTVELAIPARLIEPIQLLSPPEGATVNLESENFSWSAVPGAARYRLGFGYEHDGSKEGVQSGFWPAHSTSWVTGPTTTANKICLGGLPRQELEGLSQILVAGRTGVWTVTAEDAKGRVLGRVLTEQRRFFVAHGLPAAP